MGRVLERAADRIAIPADTSATDAATTAATPDAPRTPIATAEVVQPTAAGIASRRSTCGPADPHGLRAARPDPAPARTSPITPAPAA